MAVLKNTINKQGDTMTQYERMVKYDPGVTIGKNTVIGAGSVVTKNIPENVVAFGNPCRVYREISEHDREYFYKNEKIDWSEID